MLLWSCKMLLRSSNVLYSGFIAADAAEILEIANVCWRMLCVLTNAIYAGVCCRMLPYADECYICWRMLTYAIYADVCYICLRMLCWRMLALFMIHGSRCGGGARDRWRMLCMLTYAIYADVCWRMLGFTEADATEALEIADVCYIGWHMLTYADVCQDSRKRMRRRRSRSFLHA